MKEREVATFLPLQGGGQEGDGEYRVQGKLQRESRIRLMTGFLLSR